VNPNKTRQQLKNIDLDNEHQFPLFTHKLIIKRFRNISRLDLNFIHPLTVLTGTNKIGKTSILAMLACSHFEFQMRDIGTGEFNRCTWGRLVKFTKHDKQASDWEYNIKYKIGKHAEEKEGKRTAITKKWSGIAKKESQIRNRKVIYIDVDRITPARACSNVLFINTQASGAITQLDPRVVEYFEYVFETSFELAHIARHHNKASYKLNNVFTSFNSASGEDVLLAILLDSVQAEKKSLVLIDELELGLHPKIQRRLVDVLMDIALKDQKQFIVTTHSPTLLASFDHESRIFIEKKENNDSRSIQRISVNAAFSKMDSQIFPLLNLFYEDPVSLRIINKALESLQNKGYRDIHRHINVVLSGSDKQVKENYDVFKRTWGLSKINIGYAAVFDGDKRDVYSAIIGTDDRISFLFSGDPPEKFLLRNYLNKYPNANLQYHLDHSPAHILFSRCVEASISITENEVFNQLYKEMLNNDDFNNWLVEFEQFLLEACNYFSQKL